MDLAWLVALLLCLIAGAAQAQVDLTLHRDGFEGGLRCQLVRAGQSTLDIRSVLVEPQFRLDGEEFDSSPLQSATFWLIPQQGDAIKLGNSFDPAGAVVRVLAGRYDVEYRWRAGSEVPANRSARVLRDIVLAQDGSLVVDVPSQPLRGALLLNGAPYPNDGGRLSLVGANGLGVVALGSTAADDYAVRLIPGSYRLRYEALAIQLFMPGNHSALYGHYEVEASTTALDLDLPMVTATFSFRFDNVEAPNNVLENGILSLRTVATVPGIDGDRVDLGQSRQQTVAGWLVPGRYDVHFEALSGAEIAPANPDTRVQANRSIVAGGHTINVPTVVVQGDFLVGGDPAPGSVLESGRVYARDRHTGRDVLLGQTDFGTYQRRIIPGSYDLAYSRLAGSAVVPANGDVVFQSERALTSGTAADIDVPIADLDVQMTLNGAMFPALNLENAAVWLRSPADVEVVFGGQSSMFATGPQLLLVPGSYQVSLSRVSGSALIPRNSFARLAPSVVVSPSNPGTANLDVRTGAYDLRVSLDGAPFPLGDNRNAALELRHFEDVVALGTTDAPLGQQLFAISVAPGEDGRHGTIFYRWIEGDVDELPQNIDSPAACLVFEPL